MYLKLIAPAQLKEAAHLDRVCFRLWIRSLGKGVGDVLVVF
jgi:hypothetical protein